MANLPETATYDTGVYQLETTDPCQGGLNGVDNAPLKNLANRTAYLKQHLDALELAAGDFAPKNNAALTGSPTAPTQPLGDNSAKIATDAFVQGTVGGRLAKSVSGNSNVTLTSVEAGNAILEFSGVLTGNIAVIVPTSPTRSWIVSNFTTGAYKLTVKTASGVGVVITQGANGFVFTDGTNVYDALNGIDMSLYAPKASPQLTGTPTAPTPSQFNAGTLLATTAFVQRALGNMQGSLGLTSDTTLTEADVGKKVTMSTAAFTVTLPPVASVLAGSSFIFTNFYSAAQTITRQGSDVLTVNGVAKSTLSVPNGDFLFVQKNASGMWEAFGSAALGFSASFGASMAVSGYQKLPSGLIIQWGITGAVSSGGSLVVTLPIAFPTANLQVVATMSNSAAISMAGSVATLTTSLSTFTVYQYTTTGSAAQFRYIAIGY